MRSLWLLTFIDISNESIENYWQISNKINIDLSTNKLSMDMIWSAEHSFPPSNMSLPHAMVTNPSSVQVGKTFTATGRGDMSQWQIDSCALLFQNKATATWYPWWCWMVITRLEFELELTDTANLEVQTNPYNLFDSVLTQTKITEAWKNSPDLLLQGKWLKYKVFSNSCSQCLQVLRSAMLSDRWIQVCRLENYLRK